MLPMQQRLISPQILYRHLACHPERSEGSGSPDTEILRCAQDDSQDSTQVRSREVLSPNI